MGTYYDESLVTGLTPINNFKPANTMEQRFEKYRAYGDDRLIGVYDRKVRVLVVDVTNFEEFKEFEGQYSSGIWLTRAYYHVPKSKF